MLLLLLQPSPVMHSTALCFPWSASHSAPEHCSFRYLHLSRLLLIACLSSEISQLLLLMLLLSASTWRWPPCTDQHCLTPPPNHRISLTVDAIGLKERRRKRVLCKQSRAIVVHRLAQCAGGGVAVCLHCINCADRLLLLLLHLIKVSDDGEIILLLLLLRVKGECNVRRQWRRCWRRRDCNEIDLVPSKMHGSFSPPPPPPLLL